MIKFTVFKFICIDKNSVQNIDKNIINTKEEKDDNITVAIIENEEIVSETIIKKLQSFQELSKKEIIFKKCNFDNVAKCLKKILKNRDTFKNIEIIKFIQCTPVDSFKLHHEYNENGLKIYFIHDQPDNLPVLRFSKNINNKIFTFKKKKYIGFSIAYMDLFIYFYDLWNFISFLSNLPLHNMCSLFFLQQFEQKIEPISSAVNQYILNQYKTSYFQEFFKIFNEEIEKNETISYKICIFKNEEQIQTFLQVMQFEKDMRKIQTILILMTIEGLFFNISSMILNIQENYIYTGVENIYKQELKNYMDMYFQKIDLSKDLKIISANNKRLGFLGKVHDRYVFVYDIKEIPTKKIIKKITPLKEKNIYMLYERLGINYAISKMKNKIIDEKEVINIIVKNFIQYIVIFLNR